MEQFTEIVLHKCFKQNINAKKADYLSNPRFFIFAKAFRRRSDNSNSQKLLSIFLLSAYKH